METCFTQSIWTNEGVLAFECVPLNADTWVRVKLNTSCVGNDFYLADGQHLKAHLSMYQGSAPKKQEWKRVWFIDQNTAHMNYDKCITCEGLPGVITIDADHPILLFAHWYQEALPQDSDGLLVLQPDQRRWARDAAQFQSALDDLKRAILNTPVMRCLLGE